MTKRYAMVAEFTEIMEALWREDTNLTWDGKYWQLKDAYASPKPVNNDRPIMVNCQRVRCRPCLCREAFRPHLHHQPRRRGYQCRRGNPAAHTKRIKELAAAEGRTVHTIINPHVICRDTEAEVQQIVQAIVDGEDAEAVDTMVGTQKSSDAQSWRGHQRHQRIIGGNVHVFGTPEQVVDQFAKLKAAGCGRVCRSTSSITNPTSPIFTRNVLPLMQEAGLRKA